MKLGLAQTAVVAETRSAVQRAEQRRESVIGVGEPPSLLLPGDRVRFLPVDALP